MVFKIKTFIKDLTVGQKIDDIFVIKGKQMVPYSSKPNEYYLKFTLADASGEASGRIWQGVFSLNEVIEDGYPYRIRGSVVEFKGALQVNVDDLAKVAPEDVRAEDFIAAGPYSTKDLDRRLTDLIESLPKSSGLTLLRKIFGDEKIRSSFLLWPAATSVHHNWLGGLCQHSLEVAELCQFLARTYNLSMSLVTVGALLHDIGKLREYQFTGAAFTLTDEGKLNGHMQLGLEMILPYLSGLDPIEAASIKHIILAHHGKKEWGSPVVPQTPEAYAVFLADYTSSKLVRIKSVLEGVTSGWSDYDRFLETSLFSGQSDRGDLGSLFDDFE
ncbi:MAG: 3'-5' exoribonuclease YhaM family protein [Bacillota bacterium]|nr:HD domain-containing protein [Bacillota bacterium]NLU55300.1 HD domain-containing protein [Bacillota bacterium]HOA91494.1 HD domain-containing protein [Bacillota bacterium]HOJ45898.1 HD domain-containing protein [Bacillota bacterium]HPT61930.1 HD domain-containing protein [Bacillota bacterium]